MKERWFSMSFTQRSSRLKMQEAWIETLDANSEGASAIRLNTCSRGITWCGALDLGHQQASECRRLGMTVKVQSLVRVSQ